MKLRSLMTRSQIAGVLAVLVLIGAAAIEEDRRPMPEPEVVAGRVLILPGIRNTRFHLQSFAHRLAALVPGFEIEIRPWGTPLLGISNLQAHERNVETARAIAAEIAEWRRQHPAAPYYLIGYSGGGGLATLVVSALPAGTTIDRLVLVAPAIAPDFDMEHEILPRVSDFVVNYSSVRDLQVGLGTRVFGTIDRSDSASAGAIGFEATDAKILEWAWDERHRRFGHRGNHLGYLGRRWQDAFLLPACDPSLDRDGILDRWASR
jgi:hypothetical protein